MMKKTLININLDSSPLVSMGGPDIVCGTKYHCEPWTYDTGWHHHDVAVLGCMESGLIGFRTEKESMVLSSGMMVFVPPNFDHLEAGMGTAVTGWYLCLPKERIKFMPNEVCVLEMSDLLLPLCKRISSWGPVKFAGKTPIQKRLVMTFLDELATAKRASHLSIPMPLQSSLRLVAKQIMENPEDMKTIDHWSRIAAMSRRSFIKYFGEETGVSFARWRQLVKLHQSLKLLAEKKTVTEVALDLGYQDTSTFISIFRKQFGVSPTRYMKMENANTSVVDGLPEFKPDIVPPCVEKKY